MPSQRLDHTPDDAPHEVKPPQPGETAGAWLAVVEEKVRGLRFGVVQITIHEGKVVQIDSTERTRLEVPGSPSRTPRANSGK